MYFSNACLYVNFSLHHFYLTMDTYHLIFFNVLRYYKFSIMDMCIFKSVRPSSKICCNKPCLILKYLINLKSNMLNISLGLQIIVSNEVFVTSNIHEVVLNLTLTIIVLGPFYLTFLLKLSLLFHL